MASIATFMLEEQETVVTHIRNSDKIEVYTSEGPMITKLSKICDDYEIMTTDEKGRITSIVFFLDFKQLSVRKKTAGTEVSEEIREARRNRMIKYNESRV